MIEIYKFSGYPTYSISLETFLIKTKPTDPIKNVFKHLWHYTSNYYYVPIPKDNKLKVMEDYKNKIVNVTDYITGSLHDNDKLYFHPNCTIPRAKVTQKYIRTIKVDKADTCIVPKPRTCYNMHYIAIFLNKNTGKLYYVKSNYTWNINNKRQYMLPLDGQDIILGKKVKDYCPLLVDVKIINEQQYSDYNDTYTDDNWISFLNASLIYYGNALFLHAKDMWLAEVIYNKLHNVVSEDTVIATLGTEENAFTSELYDSISGMLTSKDKDSVGLGLKSLAELDYDKYRNSIMHLLFKTSKYWTNNNMKNSNTVKFMLKHLDMWETAYPMYTKTIEPEDFNIMEPIVKNEIMEYLEKGIDFYKTRFPFSNTQIDVSMDMLPIFTEECVKTESNE